LVEKSPNGESITCVFTNQTTPGVSYMQEDQPQYTWRNGRPRLVIPVPLGVFTVKTAYFKATRHHDLLRKVECGLLYSRDGSDVTVVQPVHQDHISTVDHVVISLRTANAADSLIQIAIHKRAWAHSWLAGHQEVYYPSVPVAGGGNIGIRVSTTVYARRGTEVRKVDGQPAEVDVLINTVTFTIPATTQQILAIAIPPNRAIRKL